MVLKTIGEILAGSSPAIRTGRKPASLGSACLGETSLIFHEVAPFWRRGKTRTLAVLNKSSPCWALAQLVRAVVL